MSAPALTIKQVAAEYGVTCDTVYGWIKKGKLRPIRLPGGDYRVRREHLAEFEDLCRVQNSTDPISESGSSAESEAEAGMSNGPTRLPAAVDPFRLGQQMRRRLTPTSKH